MKIEFRLEQFSGPLELLLGLLDDRKLSINEIALSEVTEQYISHVEQLEEGNPDELADFLLIATRLLLLKARALLPQSTPEEDDEINLADQLRLYKSFLRVSKAVDVLWQSGKKSIFRVEPPRKPEHFIAPLHFSLDTVRASMVQLVNRLQPPKPLPQTRIDRTMSMKEKILQIRGLLKLQMKTSFYDLVGNKQNRTELIVCFLALLELVKQKTVHIAQDGEFRDIVVHRA